MLFAGNSPAAEMKTLRGNSDQVIDVRPKLTVEARRRRWIVALCLSLPIAFLLWLGYSQIWKPVQFRQTVKAARDAVLWRLERNLCVKAASPADILANPDSTNIVAVPACNARASAVMEEWGAMAA
jgi:hypothetical protein